MIDRLRRGRPRIPPKHPGLWPRRLPARLNADLPFLLLVLPQHALYPRNFPPMPPPSTAHNAEGLAKADVLPLNRLDPSPLGLLPVPTPEEVAGFVTLYERRYDISLEPEQARQVLSGLMRFLYLTGSKRPTPKPALAPNPATPPME